MSTYEFDFTYEFEGQTWVGHDHCDGKSINSAREKLRRELKKQGVTKIYLCFTGMN